MKQAAVPQKTLSIVIPCYNEAANIRPFYDQLINSLRHLTKRYKFELVYVDDGSTDETLDALHQLHKDKSHFGIKIIALARNFGKEVASSCGINSSGGDAVITIDADGQHPPKFISAMVEQWEMGNDLIIGVREAYDRPGFTKRMGSKLFYALLSKVTNENALTDTTDFRLMSRAVANEFTKFTERNRNTKSLVDWLGFSPLYLPFSVVERLHGNATFTNKKLIAHALHSLVSISQKPLYFSLFSGLAIVPIAFVIGLFCVINELMGDKLNLNVSGSGYLALVIVLLVGLLLVSQGIIAVYLSHIYKETQNRPLYVVNHRLSRGINIAQQNDTR